MTTIRIVTKTDAKTAIWLTPVSVCTSPLLSSLCRRNPADNIRQDNDSDSVEEIHSIGTINNVIMSNGHRNVVIR